MAESYITRKGGGGGAKINAIIEQYKIATSSSAISVGDFVEWAADAKFTTTNQTINSTGGGDNFTTVVKLDETRVLVVFDNIELRAVVLTISGATITVGTQLVLTTSGTFDYLYGILVDTNKVLIVSKSSINSNRTEARILNVSSTTVTSSSVFVVTTNNINFHRLVKFNTNKIALIYAQTTTNYFSLIVLTVSGNDLTVGSENVLSSAYYPYAAGAYVEDNKILITYTDASLNFDGYARVITFVGDTPTMQTAIQIDRAGDPFAIASIDASRVLVAYRHSTSTPSGLSKAAIISVNGNSLTFNTPVILGDVTGFRFSCDVLNASEAIVVYNNIASYLKINGVNLVKQLTEAYTTGTPLSSSTSYVVLLSPGKAISAFRDQGDFSRTNSVLIQFNLGEVSLSDEANSIGIAKTEGVAGDIIDVYVNGNPYIAPVEVKDFFDIKTAVVGASQTINKGDLLLLSDNSSTFPYTSSNVIFKEDIMGINTNFIGATYSKGVKLNKNTVLFVGRNNDSPNNLIYKMYTWNGTDLVNPVPSSGTAFFSSEQLNTARQYWTTLQLYYVEENKILMLFRKMNDLTLYAKIFTFNGSSFTEFPTAALTSSRVIDDFANSYAVYVFNKNLARIAYYSGGGILVKSDLVISDSNIITLANTTERTGMVTNTFRNFQITMTARQVFMTYCLTNNIEFAYMPVDGNIATNLTVGTIENNFTSSYFGGKMEANNEYCFFTQCTNAGASAGGVRANAIFKNQSASGYQRFSTMTNAYGDNSSLHQKENTGLFITNDPNTAVTFLLRTPAGSNTTNILFETVTRMPNTTGLNRSNFITITITNFNGSGSNILEPIYMGDYAIVPFRSISNSKDRFSVLLVPRIVPMRKASPFSGTGVALQGGTTGQNIQVAYTK
jgi:hypothetical protein